MEIVRWRLNRYSELKLICLYFSFNINCRKQFCNFRCLVPISYCDQNVLFGIITSSSRSLIVDSTISD